MSNERSAWALAQLIGGITPPDISADWFEGQYADAYHAYATGNGTGERSLRAFLAQPKQQSIKQAVFAYRAGDPCPPERKSFHLTDIGNAERLAQRHGQRLRHVPEWGWMCYLDGVWVRREGKAEQAATDTVRSIYAEAEACEDDERRKEIAKHAMRSESSRSIDAMLKIAKSRHQIMASVKDFDLDPYMLAVRNGVVDLTSGKLMDHKPERMISRIANVDYDKDAACPTWLRFLDRIFDANKSLIEYVQSAMGYSLTGDISEHKMFFCYGTGRNGKSTLLETAAEVIGEYAATAETNTFMLRHTESARNDIACLVGMRYVTAIEAADRRRLDETLIKQMTGGDAIKARFLYREHFEFRPQFKLWLAANHKPVIRGTDEGIWSRVLLVPFNVTIPAAERDKRLRDKLRQELPGILAWMVRGCLRWQKHGLQEPAAVTDATKEYRTEMDMLAAFIDECCVTNEQAVCRAGNLYEAYKKWCDASGEHSDNQRQFGQRLTERGYQRQRAPGGHHTWRGIGILDE
jgi:putative DNA primase/helicase